MKVLLGECTPRELLSLAERERFDVLVTTDQNLRHQQDLSKRSLGVMVLPSNQVPVVVKLLPEIEKILPTLTRGSVMELQLPPQNRGSER